MNNTSDIEGKKQFIRLLERHPIQCYQCGNSIGERRLDSKCSKCGFSNEESLVQWILEREGFHDTK